jgi:hypothetical protein
MALENPHKSTISSHDVSGDFCAVAIFEDTRGYPIKQTIKVIYIYDTMKN